ncbi:MAG: hypothetical protein CVV21_00780 [Candidatus Goldiibacteriota bacterium HGW-Goldbacteria-1]|jgi:2-iminobutanoate/2-iminopropanoate deaminase|nr:MAG: hypothetical protein CVV21_00780 [Candidatus Goldiibacteriota bacterium HGW-Goldbacteria-1]
MAKEIIFTDKAPKPIGAYSQAVKCGNLLFLSGLLPIVPETGHLSTEGIHKETRLIFQNMEAVLQTAGSSIENVLKMTVFMTNLDDFKFVNEVMEELFGKNLPARSTVQVAALPKGANIEIEAIAEI